MTTFIMSCMCLLLSGALADAKFCLQDRETQDDLLNLQTLLNHVMEMTVKIGSQPIVVTVDLDFPSAQGTITDRILQLLFNLTFTKTRRGRRESEKSHVVDDPLGRNYKHFGDMTR